MPLTVTQTPTFAGQSQVGKGTMNNLALQNFYKPEWDEVIFEQTNKWWMYPFLEDYCGVETDLKSDTFYWTEDGKWYNQQTIQSAAANGANWDITLVETDPYFVTFDVVDLGFRYRSQAGLNTLGRVIAVSTAGANQVITVEIMDPRGTAAVVVGDFVANNKIALLYNLQGECFEIPSGRTHSPDRYENNLNKIANTYEFCDDYSREQIWMKSDKGTHYWVDHEERRLWEIHRMQCDKALMFGLSHTFTEAGTGYQGKGGTGMIPFISYNGVLGNYSGDVVEDDIITMLKVLGNYSKHKTWKVICGSEWNRRAQEALKPYYLNGGVYYGKFSGDVEAKGHAVGINTYRYKFHDTTIDIMPYAGFSDPNFLPANATGVDFDAMALFVNLEGDNKKLMFKAEREGGYVKEWINHTDGPTMAARGAAVTNRRACSEIIYTTHVGLKYKGSINDGMMEKV